jgi:hypothetical protein
VHGRFDLVVEQSEENSWRFGVEVKKIRRYNMGRSISLSECFVDLRTRSLPWLSEFNVQPPSLCTFKGYIYTFQILLELKIVLAGRTGWDRPETLLRSSTTHCTRKSKIPDQIALCRLLSAGDLAEPGL